MNQRWTERQVPPQQGRVAVVTGANSGLGLETARALAVRGADVVLAVRNTDKGRRAAERIRQVVPGARLTVQKLDLASLESIRTAAAELRATHSKIDLLINNAGIGSPAQQTTRDGFELHFGTNHLGHFALTGLLLDRLLSAPDSRIVTVSSLAERFDGSIDFDDLQWERGYTWVRAYGRSKLANMMFTYELHRRLSRQRSTTMALAAHPGVSATQLARNVPAMLRPISRALVSLAGQSAALGALPTLRAATDPGALGGQYYGPGGLAEVRGFPRPIASGLLSYDLATQERLWAVSEQLTDVTFPV